jgi:NifU-like protein involved in Fe-S cluster formation
MHCSVLAEEALKKALDDYQMRNAKLASEKAA